MENLKTKKINVTINGKNLELTNSLTVEQMLVEREVSGTMFVVEKNLQIVAKENYSDTPVEEGDVFEIVGFFGGG